MIISQIFNVFVILYFRLNLHLIKMEREDNTKKQWNPTDQQYISSLITQEAVNATWREGTYFWCLTRNIQVFQIFYIQLLL